MKNYYKTIFYGTVALIFGFFFARYFIGNPLNGGAILLWGASTGGYITNTYEDVEGNETGVHYISTVNYSFKLNEKYYDETYNFSGKLKPEFSYIEEPYPVEIEYFIYFPSINRIKGIGAESLLEWFFREFCLGLLLYILFLSIGASLIKTGLKERRNAK